MTRVTFALSSAYLEDLARASRITTTCLRNSSSRPANLDFYSIRRLQVQAKSKCLRYEIPVVRQNAAVVHITFGRRLKDSKRLVQPAKRGRHTRKEGAVAFALTFEFLFSRRQDTREMHNWHISRPDATDLGDPKDVLFTKTSMSMSGTIR